MVLREEYIVFPIWIAHVVLLRPCMRNLHVKTHIEKKSTPLNLLGHLYFMIFYSSWIKIDHHMVYANIVTEPTNL